jgi:NAD-dependent dihydropyrimidine dehydrogenase PreA subunit
MRGYRYIAGTTTLEVDRQRCVGCGLCTVVCPHRIFALTSEGLEVKDRDQCMECGACARNCPAHAITVSPGVGCASALIAGWMNRLLGRKAGTACC